MRKALILALMAGMARAEGEPAGQFDYYVLSLSWSPNWCQREGDARQSPQCAPGRELGWVLHGLWPQYEEGWPSFCPSAARDPSRSDTAAMADIMGTSGLAWYQWKKHGRCSGLTADAYFEVARRAYEAIERPEVLRKLDRAVTLPASLIEKAFLQANPGLGPDMITVTCKQGQVQEVRICLTKDLQPRDCAPDAARDCSLPDALFNPIDQ